MVSHFFLMKMSVGLREEIPEDMQTAHGMEDPAFTPATTARSRPA